MTDGSIVFSTELDNSQLENDIANVKKEIEDSEKQLSAVQKRTNKAIEDRERLYKRLEKELEKQAELEKKLAEQQNARNTPIARAEELQEKMVKEKALADQYRADELSGRVGADQDLMAALEQLAAMKEQYKEVIAEIEKIDAKIEKATENVEQQKSKVKEAEGAWIDAKCEVRNLREESERLNSDIDAMNDKAGELVWKTEEASVGSSRMGDAVKTAGTHMDKFLDRVKRLVGRVFVFSMITRAFRELIGWLWKVIQTDAEAARAFGQLKGALLTLAQPLVNVIIPAFTFLVNLLAQIITAISKLFAKLFGYSYSDTKKQAQALNKEANAIGGVGEAAKEASKYLAGFDELNTLPEETKDFGGGGGAGGLGNLTAPNFEDPGVTDYLDNILYLIGAIGAGLLAWRIARAFTDDLALAAGIGLAVGGALLFAFNWADAFANGIDWLNLAGMLAGLAVAVGGAYLIFTSLAPAFTLIAMGITLLVGGLALAILALYEWAKTGELSNAACMALVAGILAIGGGIALMTGSWIPLLVGAIVALVVLIGKYGDEIQAILQKLDDWLQNIFVKDWTTVFGIVIGELMNGCMAVIKDVWDGIKLTFDGVINFIRGVFTGNWERAWNGVVQIFSGIFGLIESIARAPINGVISLLNIAINAINALINGLNGIGFDLPAWLGGGSFHIRIPPIDRIPYLAKGAVIPPNREFMAVLGDQRHGNNIEAPEDLIRKIVREETAGRGDDQLAALLEELIAVVGNIRVGDDVIGRAAQRYNRSSERARGW